jgi:hypothetical protein
MVSYLLLQNTREMHEQSLQSGHLKGSPFIEEEV